MGAHVAGGGWIYSVARANGKVYAGGYFLGIGPYTGGGVVIGEATGLYEKSWPTVGGIVYVIQSDGFGGWYIGGDFASVGGVNRRNLAHIRGDGSLDTGWNPPILDSDVTTLVVSGEKVYAGGSFLSVGGDAKRRSLARFNKVNGSLDIGWTPPELNGSVTTLTVSGGKVYVGGWFISVGGDGTRHFLARLNESDGGLDADWKPPYLAHYSYDSYVSALVVSGGKVYVGGWFKIVGGEGHNCLARFNETDGSLDADWAPPCDGGVYTLAVSGGKVYGFGGFIIGGKLTKSLARFNESNGDRDTGWNPPYLTDDPYNTTVSALVVSGDKVYVGGHFENVGGDMTYHNLARFNDTNGNLDKEWKPALKNDVFALAVTGEKVYVGGDFTSVGRYETAPSLARFNETDGSLDTGWTFPGVSGEKAKVLAVSGGKVYVGGGWEGHNSLARFNETDGSLDKGWTPPALDDGVSALAINGGKVYVGGWFSSVGGDATRPGLARFSETDGSLDTGWTPPALEGGYVGVSALAVSGGKIYASGWFDSVGGDTTRRYLARFNQSDGSLDTGWTPPLLGSTVYALAVSGDKVYVGGHFESVGGDMTYHYLARFNDTNGNLDKEWKPALNNDVYALAVGGEKVYAGGWFSSVGGDATRPGLARFSETDGSLDSGWTPAGVAGSVHALAVSGDLAYVGGDGFFTQFGQSAPSAPSQPINTHLLGVGAHTVGGGWSGFGGAKSYTLAASESGANPPSSISASLTTTITSGTLSGLMADTEYHVWVKGCNDVGCSDYASIGSTKTLASLEPIPSVPKNGQVTSVTANRVTATWSGSSGATSYTLAASLNPANPPNPIAVSVTTTALSETLSGLIPNTMYYFFVRACNEVGCSDYASLGSNKTLSVSVPPLAPSGGKVNSVGLRSLKAEWEPAAGATSYVLSARETIENSLNRVATENMGIRTTSTVGMLTELAVDTAYEVFVKACNDAGCSEEAHLGRVRTWAEAAETVGTARAYPTVLKAGEGASTMTLDRLPPETRMRMYSVGGALVRELATDGNGRAVWDGRGDSGEPVGSGVYYLVAEKDGAKKTTKVVVRR